MRQGSSRSSFDFCSTNIHPARSTTTSALTDALFCSSSFHYREKAAELFHVFDGISTNCRSQIMFTASINKFVYFSFCKNSILVTYPYCLTIVRLVCFVLFLTLAENLLRDSFNGGFLAVFVLVITIYFNFLFKGFSAIKFGFCFIAFRDNN